MHEKLLVGCFFLLWMEKRTTIWIVFPQRMKTSWNGAYYSIHVYWAWKIPDFRADSNQTPEQVSWRITSQIPQFPANYGLHNRQEQANYGKKSSRVSRLCPLGNRQETRKYPKAHGKQWGYYFSNVAMRTKGIWWELFGNLVGTKGYWWDGLLIGTRGIWWEFLGTWWEQEEFDENFWELDGNNRNLMRIFGNLMGTRGIWWEFLGTWWEQKKFSIQEAIGWDVQNHRAQPTRANVDTLFEVP